MNSRVNHLHCRYRTIGQKNSTAAIQVRLDHMAQKDMPKAFAHALDQVLGDDPAVYVIKNINSRLMINLSDNNTDTEIARRWGESLAGAVMRRIASGNGVNVIRFEDQADYVAGFIRDLLNDGPLDTWVYGSFSRLRALGTSGAIRAVLTDNKEHLPAILAKLHRNGIIERVMDLLDEKVQQQLWSREFEYPSEQAANSLRPLFRAALDLLNQLELRAEAHLETEKLFSEYLAVHSTLMDWRDPKSMSAIVLGMIRFLAEKVHIRKRNEDTGRITASELKAVVTEFDWLDVELLEEGLLDFLKREVRETNALYPANALDPLDRTGMPDAGKKSLPVRPVEAAPTPRQRKLLEDLADALNARPIRFDEDRPECPANALGLYALLIAHSPGWKDDPLVAGVIQRLLKAVGYVLYAVRSNRKSSSNTGKVPLAGILHQLPPHEKSRAARTFDFFTHADHNGRKLIEKLARVKIDLAKTDPVIDTGSVWIKTKCAGLFLLLRAVLDTRLTGLVKTTGYPVRNSQDAVSALLLALGLRWAGEAGIRDSALDDGLVILSGADPEFTIEKLKEIWSRPASSDHARFQLALMETLSSQRLLRGKTMHIHMLERKNGNTALIAGDETDRLWGLCRFFRSMEPAGGTINEWICAWEKATGIRPDVVADRELAAAHSGLPEEVVFVTESPSAKVDPEDRHETHAKGRDALEKALDSIEHGCMGLPEADLTLSLAAMALLRAWARWLPRFSDSSIPYLLKNFIHREGRIMMDKHRIQVEMDGGPVDVVVEMAGYTADLGQVAFLGGRRVQYAIRKG